MLMDRKTQTIKMSVFPNLISNQFNLSQKSQQVTLWLLDLDDSNIYIKKAKDP